MKSRDKGANIAPERKMPFLSKMSYYRITCW